jgi:hypothetical protein
MNIPDEQYQNQIYEDSDVEDYKYSKMPSFDIGKGPRILIGIVGLWLIYKAVNYLI